MYRTVECDNCGAEYTVFDTDKNEELFWHRICDTCYMPMKVENPFYRRLNNGTDIPTSKVRRETR